MTSACRARLVGVHASLVPLMDMILFETVAIYCPWVFAPGCNSAESCSVRFRCLEYVC